MNWSRSDFIKNEQWTHTQEANRHINRGCWYFTLWIWLSKPITSGRNVNGAGQKHVLNMEYSKLPLKYDFNEISGRFFIFVCCQENVSISSMVLIEILPLTLKIAYSCRQIHFIGIVDRNYRFSFDTKCMKIGQFSFKRLLKNRLNKIGDDYITSRLM